MPTAASAAVSTPQKEVATKHFVVPLRTTEMDTDSASSKATSCKETPPGKTGRSPPIILTSAVNLIQLQKQLKGVVSEDFEFRSTRNGTRVITRGMADFQSVKSHFENKHLSYYTFYPKSEKPIKAVIRHLPHGTPAEDISDGLVSLGFDVVSVKQMTTSRSPPEESKVITLPLSLVTLPRTAKSQESFPAAKPLPHCYQEWRRIGPRIPLRSATTANSLATYGQIANSLLAVCGAAADTCTRSAPRRGTHLPSQHAATAGWRKEKNRIPSTVGVAVTRGRNSRKRSQRRHPKPQREGCSLLPAPPQASPSRRHSEAAQTSSSSNPRQTMCRRLLHPQQ
jgi:hypothetical protein